MMYVLSNNEFDNKIGEFIAWHNIIAWHAVLNQLVVHFL